MRYFSFLFFLIYSSVLNVLSAQDIKTFTLEECLNLAERLSPELESRRLADRAAAQTTMGTRSEARPTVGLQSRVGYQFGRSIDPTTNSFADQGILFNSNGISAEWLVYNGGSQRVSVKRAELDQLASELETELAYRNLRERIIIVYGKALEARAGLELQERMLTNQQARLDELNRLIEIGIYPANDRLEPAVKLARLERERNLAKQQYGFFQRELAARIGVDKQERIQPAIVTVEPTMNTFPLQNFGASTEGRLAKAWIERATADQEIARRANGPRLTVFGQLSTNYSAAARELVGVESFMASQNVVIDGTVSQLSAEQQLPIYDNKNLINQLGDNFNQVIGLQLSVPIYDGGRNISRRQVAKLQQLRAQAEQQVQLQQYNLNVSQLQNARREGKINHEQAQEQLLFARQTLDQAETAFRQGGISATEVSRVQEEVALAAIQEIRARYAFYINNQLLKEIKNE